MSHSNNGIEFYSEMIPHMNSIIIYLFGLQQPENINIMKNKDKSIIKFKYNQINVEYVWQDLFRKCLMYVNNVHMIGEAQSYENTHEFPR